MSEMGVKKFDWEIRREVSPNRFRSYAHGYWRPFVVHVMGHTIIGKRALRKRWAESERGGFGG